MKRANCLLLSLILIITSSITVFAADPRTKDELIERFRSGVQTSKGDICPTAAEVETFEKLISRFELNARQISCVSSFLDGVNAEILKNPPKNPDDMGVHLKFKIVRLSTRLAKDLVKNNKRQ